MVKNFANLLGKNDQNQTHCRLETSVLHHKNAIKAIVQLQKEDSILILPANKGKATVIMDKNEYEQIVTTMLADERTYEVLKKDATRR